MDSLDRIGSELPDHFVRWAVIAVVISLLLHVAFAFWAFRHPLSRMGDAYYDEIVPRKFQIDRLEIDPALLEGSDELPKPRMESTPVPLDLPPERPADETPAASLTERPQPSRLDPSQLTRETPGSESSAAIQLPSPATSNIDRELASLREELLENDATSPARPLLELPLPSAGGASEGSSWDSPPPGYSNLDQLLSQTGPLTDATGPILMPADLLFDYDEFELREEARAELTKLGQLIERNPAAQFTIEGHTDTIGSNEYNQLLSERRALSVKSWLVSIMGVNESQIQTIGFGRSRPLVHPDGDKDQQAPNRRVEIAVELPETPVRPALRP